MVSVWWTMLCQSWIYACLIWKRIQICLLNQLNYNMPSIFPIWPHPPLPTNTPSYFSPRLESPTLALAYAVRRGPPLKPTKRGHERGCLQIFIAPLTSRGPGSKLRNCWSAICLKRRDHGVFYTSSFSAALQLADTLPPQVRDTLTPSSYLLIFLMTDLDGKNNWVGRLSLHWKVDGVYKTLKNEQSIHLDRKSVV